MRQSFLIFCEGETELGYFISFKKSAKAIKGGNALAIVKEAIKQKEATTKDVDQYWVVFDKDDTTDTDFNAAIKLSGESGIRAAWSNQAFELWFILHYVSFTAACNRNRYKTILKKYITDYDASKKGKEQGKQLFETTYPMLMTAIANAEASYKSFDAQGLEAAQKESCTTVYELVRLL